MGWELRIAPRTNIGATLSTRIGGRRKGVVHVAQTPGAAAKLERNGELDEENPSSDSDEEQRADSSSGGESPPHIRHVRKPRDERPKCLRRCGCMPYCCRELRDCLLALILMYWALDRLGQKHGWGKEWFLLQ